MQAFNLTDRPAPVGYSGAIEVRAPQRMVFTSGQVAMDAVGNIPDGIEDQTRLALANLAGVLAEAGMSFANIVKLGIFLTREDDLPGFMSAASAGALAVPPASTLVFVRALVHPALRVEIEAVAVA